MKNFTLLLLIFTAGASLTACRKHTSSPDTGGTLPTQGPYLYVGGNSLSKAVYWKKSLSQPGTVTIQDTLTGGENITSIITSGNDVYMTTFGLSVGGYWKNGSLVTIPGAYYLLHIALSGNTIYTSGKDNDGNLAYWTGNTKNILQSPLDRSLFPYQGVTSYSFGNIALSGSDVLVSGNMYFENMPGAPANAAEGNFGLLWKNGSLNLLGKGVSISADYASTSGIAVAGSDVYVAGRFPDTTYAGGYWKNGVWNSINNGAFLPYSITASGRNVYIAGATTTKTPPYSQQAAYWVNGNLIQLSGGVAIAIAVDGNDVYILGVDNNNKIVVWKNGNNLFTTIGSVTEGGANCIAVGN